MKVNSVFYALLSLLGTMILFVSCGNEETPMDQISGGGNDTFLTFSFRSNTTHTFETLAIYMFNTNSGQLLSITEFSDLELDEADEATVSVDIAGRTGRHAFYFVANAGVYAASLADVTVGSVTEDEFRQRLSDRFAGIALEPLMMTSHTVVAHVEAPVAGETKVIFQRRMARVDINNDPAVTGFMINKILIFNAYLQAYLFANAFDDPSVELQKGTLPIIDYTLLPNANTSVPVEGAFYLFPTDIGEGKTEIWLDGLLGGERTLYRIRPGIRIEANFHYMVNMTLII